MRQKAGFWPRQKKKDEGKNGMDAEKARELLEALKQYDTPSVTNVVATYPQDKELCLGLYHPWEGKWYTDDTLKCMYPELGRTVG